MHIAIIENETIRSVNEYPKITNVSEVKKYFDDTITLVEVSSDFVSTNKKYINGEFVEYEVEELIPEQDEINAEILLNQATILENQAFQDTVLAEILLNQMEG